MWKAAEISKSDITFFLLVTTVGTQNDNFTSLHFTSLHTYALVLRAMSAVDVSSTVCGFIYLFNDIS